MWVKRDKNSTYVSKVISVMKLVELLDELSQFDDLYVWPNEVGNLSLIRVHRQGEEMEVLKTIGYIDLVSEEYVANSS